MELSATSKIFLAALPLSAFAATIVWLAYVIKFGDELSDHSAAERTSMGGSTGVQLARAETAFQAVVVTILLYFTFHHGLERL